jgi:hypothetical protein
MATNQVMRWLLAYMVLTVVCGAASSGEKIDDRKFGFRLTVPDGFKRYRDREQGDVIYTFATPPPAAKPLLIQIMRMRGVIGTERLDPKVAAKQAANIAIVTEHWKSHDVDVLRMPIKVGGKEWVVFQAQIPLKREAVQLGVGGPIANEAESRKLLRSLLGSLEGDATGADAAKPNRGVPGTKPGQSEPRSLSDARPGSSPGITGNSDHREDQCPMVSQSWKGTSPRLSEPMRSPASDMDGAESQLALGLWGLSRKRVLTPFYDPFSFSFPKCRFDQDRPATPVLAVGSKAVSGDGVFTVRTGHVAFRTTCSATLPISTRLNPVRP